MDRILDDRRREQLALQSALQSSLPAMNPPQLALSPPGGVRIAPRKFGLTQHRRTDSPRNGVSAPDALMAV